MTLLLWPGADPNVRTRKNIDPNNDPESQTDPQHGDGIYMETPLHIAIRHQHHDVVQAFLEHRCELLTTLIRFTLFKSFFPHAANLLHSTGGPRNSPTPDFNLRDSKDRTVLALAVWSGFYKVAAQLLNSGADINYR